MAILPNASLTVDEQASAYAIGTGYIVVMGCVSQNADSVPRLFSSTQDMLTEHNYAPAIDYCAQHFEATNLPVIFVGLPIATAGYVGSVNNRGVTGTSMITVSAASSGILEKCSGVFTVTSGVVVGTDQISGTLSMDGGVSTQPVRLGSNTSYTVPLVGVVLSFGTGTLNPGDVFTFETAAPMWGSTAISLARTNLADQTNLARSWLVEGRVPNSTFAQYVLTEANNYFTSNERFTYARVQTNDYGPLAKMSSVKVTMQVAPAITFSSSAHTITRGTGSFITDGFAVGDMVTVAGSTADNGTFGPITTLTATVMTFAAGLVTEGPDASGVTIVGSESLVFAASGFTITRAGDIGTATAGSFLNDGFAVGQTVQITGTTSNNASLVITGVTATVMTFAAGIANETNQTAAVSIVQTNTLSAYVAAQTAAFAVIDAAPRIDLGLGRGTVQSPITGWNLKRPVEWAASLREYQHDLQIPCWRKADGPIADWTIADANGNRNDYDERTIGGALAGRFTCFRSYANGPKGAFIALSLTRDTEGSLFSRTHNLAVANFACQVVQAETEMQIGQVLELNADGTATSASLGVLQNKVNEQLQINLLANEYANSSVPAEGPRASSAFWTASTTDVLKTAGATLHGTLNLELDGTLEQIATAVVVS